MVIYYVLLLGNLVLGLYDDPTLCQRASAERPGAICEMRQIRSHTNG